MSFASRGQSRPRAFAVVWICASVVSGGSFITASRIFT